MCTSLAELIWGNRHKITEVKEWDSSSFFQYFLKGFTFRNVVPVLNQTSHSFIIDDTTLQQLNRNWSGSGK